MISGLIENYRRVRCRRCNEPIPVSPEPSQDDDRHADVPGGLIARCRVCEHEGVYAIRDVQTLAGEPRRRNSRLSSNPKQPTFDIFCGVPDKDAIWYDAVEGLANARDRMEQIARIIPGNYFVFSRRDHSILARTETICKATARPLAQRERKGKLAG